MPVIQGHQGGGGGSQGCTGRLKDAVREDSKPDQRAEDSVQRRSSKGAGDRQVRPERCVYPDR
jgi:hypothetical protein